MAFRRGKTRSVPSMLNRVKLTPRPVSLQTKVWPSAGTQETPFVSGVPEKEKTPDVGSLLSWFVAL